MAIIPQVITEASASGAQVVDGSLVFNGDDQYLTKTFASAGNRQKFSFSFWAKRSEYGATNMGIFSEYPGSGNGEFVRFSDDDGGDTFRFYSSELSAQSLVTKRKFRDTGWYHICVAVDTTESTDTDRVKIYINGERNIDWASSTWPSQDGEYDWLNATAHYIGRCQSGSYFPGSLSQFYVIDGEALEPSEFGFTDPLTNIWRPKKYTGSYNISAGGDSIVSGATVLTWDDSPIGNYDLTNSDKTATTNDGGTGYANGDVWSIAIAANTTYAFTLDITNGDSTGGWYFTDSQTDSNTHADERGGNSCGLRGGETSMGTHGTFATANGTSSGQSQISVDSAVSPNGTKKIDFVVYRPSSGDGKVWIRGYGASSWLGGGDPTNTSSTATFAIPDGTTYFGMTAYSRGTAQVLTFDELVTAATGVNSFYLPLDGSGPIGRDQSPNANDWTPVNFGGSTVIPKATGALPILNTQNGGKVATPGIRGQVGIAVTVFDSGSGDKFYLDGVETLSLEQYRGQTVTFDLSDSTNASHPLRFSTTSDGTHGGGSEYSEGKQEGGTPGSVGAATTITYPHNAADTLYYYCPNHSAMGGSVELSTDIQKADPYAWRNVLALPLVGNSVDVGIACTSTTKTITTTNAVTNLDYSNFYGGSYSFDGSGDYIVVTNDSELVFGTGTFTIECWMYADTYNSLTYPTVISKYDNGDASWILRLKSDGDIVWYAGQVGGGTNNESTTQPIRLNCWQHVAVVREGTGSNETKVYFDGQLVLTCTDSSDYDDTNNIYIGRQDSSNANEFDGYIQDVRIYKGVAKYVNDFIPASTNPDILPDTPSGVVYGSELTKITDGAVKFDGTGDYLNIPDSADFDMGTGDFTLECWVNSIDDSDYQGVFGSNDYDNDMVLLQINNAGLLRFTNPSTIDQTGTTDLQNSGWHHIVMCRSGTTLKGFVDGREEISVTYSSSIDWGHGDNSIVIGTVDATDYPGQYQYKGHISNLRLVKGTALYTQNFTPSPGPLAAVTNTKLLCCQSNTSPVTAAVAPDAGTATAKLNAPLSSTPFADSSSTGATITNTGSIAAASAGTNNFDITNAASLDGSSQRLSTDNTNLYFNGKWTVDVWFKLDSSASGYNAIINTGYPGSGSYLYFALDDDEKPYVEGGSAGGRTTATNALNKNQWYQMRVRADGADIKQYINGELVVTHGVNTTDLSSAGTKTIGSLLDNGNNANNFHGLIGPVRYTRGDLGPPVAGGESTSSGAVSNTPDLPDIVALGDAEATTFNPFTTDINTVMGQETGYCTLNPLWRNSTQTNGNNPPLFKDGNLTADYQDGTPAGNYFKSALGTIGVDSTKGGKWYFETTAGGGGYCQVGMVRDDYQWEVGKSGWGISGSTRGLAYQSDGGFQINASTIKSSLTTATTYGQIMSWLIDFDNKTVNAWVDGLDVGYTVDITSYLSDTDSIWYPAISIGDWSSSLTNNETMYVNFGQKPFKFTPPEGYQSINLANLPSPEFVRPDQYVGVGTYTGTGAAHDINVGFAPDLVWIKRRNGANYHHLFDTVRGNDKVLYGGDTSIDDPFSDFDFNSNGFAISGTANGTNASAQTYVSWNWKAGGNKNTFNVDDVGYASAAAAGLTGGDITPVAASVGTKQGFSIIQYQGNSSANQSIPHGLTQAPDFSIFKNMDGVSNWTVFHRSMTTTNEKVIYLNTTGAVADYSGSNTWWYQLPGDSLFYVGDTSTAINNGTNDIISYHWHDVPGLQKFGSYEGTELSDPETVFVDCGFRPSWIMVKNIDATEDWYMWDNKRDGYNPTYQYLEANLYTAENSTTNDAVIDILSNGFKIRVQYAPNNASTYIYAAFAEQPMNGFYGAQSNAR